MRKEIIPEKVYCFGVHIYDEYGYRQSPYSKPQIALRELRHIDVDQVEFDTNANYTLWVRDNDGSLVQTGEGNFFQYTSFRNSLRRRLEEYDSF